MDISTNSNKYGPLKIIGLSIRTSNENQQATIDIPKLWSTFFSDNTLSKITNKINDDLFCIYHNYDSDFTKPYTCTLGVKVNDFNAIPEGLVGIEIPPSNFLVYNTKGNLSKHVVYNQWINIWSANIDRKYSFDFEIYNSEKCKDPLNAEVDIYISIK